MDGATIETVKGRASRLSRRSCALSAEELAVVGLIERTVKETRNPKHAKRAA
jgi:hypothetical protein